MKNRPVEQEPKVVAAPVNHSYIMSQKITLLLFFLNKSMRITESTNFNNFWYTRSGDTRHFKDINLATSSVYYCHNTLGNAKVMHKHKHWSSVFLVGSFCVTF